MMKDEVVQGSGEEVFIEKEMREHLRKSEATLESIFASAPNAITVSDLNGNIIDCNQATLDMHGFSSKEELIGKSALGLIAEKDCQRAMENLKKTLEQGSAKSVEYTFLTKDGREFPAELSATAIKDPSGKPIGFVAITKDITERKNMEERLKEYSEDLEKKVEERTNQLKQAQDQLLKSERLAAIGEIASMVGHDLRNPLSGIASATYYLKKKLNPETPSKTRNMLDIIEKNIEYSDKIINDLLDYSTQIRLTLREVAPKSIIQESVSLSRIPQNIEVLDLTQNEPKINMDADMMKRVFVNIIKNAVEVMPNGGKLTIKSKESGGNVEIAFSDNGVGIPRENVGKLFTPLFTTKAKGMGLGLAICKRIVEAHGGHIRVESTVNEGTTFTVIVPITAEVGGGEKI